jgi:cytoskeletal protein CcmA (bactofilin family)
MQRQEETVFELLLKQLDSQIDRIKDCMIEQDLVHDEYLRLRGLVQGLVYGKNLIIDLAKRMENDADE